MLVLVFWAFHDLTNHLGLTCVLCNTADVHCITRQRVFWRHCNWWPQSHHGSLSMKLLSDVIPCVIFTS